MQKKKTSQTNKASTTLRYKKVIKILNFLFYITAESDDDTLWLKKRTYEQTSEKKSSATYILSRIHTRLFV